jgi:hypothetical protein
MKVDGRGIWTGVAAAGLAVMITAMFQGCDDDDYYDDYYDNYYYAYGYYYPSDMMYAMPVYTDYWYGYPYSLRGGGSILKGSTTNSLLPGEALRELGTGESLCPGQVTQTIESIDAVCDVGGEGTLPIRAEVVFDGCELVDGGILDGSILVEATQTFSDMLCDTNTVVEVDFSSTVTDLSYTSTTGVQLVLPSLTIIGSYTRTIGGPPSSMTASMDGRIERYSPDGDPIMLATVRGTQTLTPLLLANTGFSAEGTMTLQDTIGGRTIVASGTELTRSDGCCRPTSGTLQINGTGSSNALWSFGPECGDVSLNGNPVTVDECL